MTTRHSNIFDDISRQPPERTGRKAGSQLTTEDKLYFLWGLANEWSYAKIAQGAKCSEMTVHRYRASVFNDPTKVFSLPVYSVSNSTIKLKGGLPKQQYNCRFCSTSKFTQMQIMRHVLWHFLPFERARDANLDKVNRRL